MKWHLIISILLIITMVTPSAFGDAKSYSGIMAVPTYYNAADMYDSWGEVFNLANCLRQSKSIMRG